MLRHLGGCEALVVEEPCGTGAQAHQFPGRGGGEHGRVERLLPVDGDEFVVPVAVQERGDQAGAHAGERADAFGRGDLAGALRRRGRRAVAPVQDGGGPYDASLRLGQTAQVGPDRRGVDLPPRRVDLPHGPGPRRDPRAAQP